MLPRAHTTGHCQPSSVPGQPIPESIPALRIARAQWDDFAIVAESFEAVRSYNASLDHRFTLAHDWRDILLDHFASTFTDPGSALWLVAWSGTQAIGLLVVFVHHDSPLLKHRRWAEVAALYVNPSFRGGGVAQGLMVEAQSWAAVHGFDRVQVHAAATNDQARSFYRRAGFQPHQEVLRLEVLPYVERIAA